jgi:hypothetical protein
LRASVRAASSTDRDAFEKLVKKGATLASEKAQFACVCQDSGVAHGVAGVVRDGFVTNELVVLCFLPSFGPDGHEIGEGFCNQYVPLGK